MNNTHSSILPEPDHLSQYCGGEVKYYYLPLYSQGPVPVGLAQQLGCYNHELRSFEEVKSSITKAIKGQYSHIKVPYDRTDCELIGFVLKSCEQNSLPVVLQVFVSLLSDNEFYQHLLQFAPNFEVEWVLDHAGGESLDRLQNLNNKFSRTHLSIPVHAQMDWGLVYCPKLFRLFKNIHLYFGYQLSHDSEYLNCTEAHHLVGLLRQRFPENRFLPPKGVDLWDSRAHHELDLEPYILPCYQTQSESPQVKYSVIIPTYNNENHIQVVLRHLYKQDVGLDQFEVIIVDDGGNDRTQYFIMELLTEFREPMNFKYIFFPRTRNRTRGDAQYRAGISRNLGVKSAEGEILCFLDSDIVVPEDYLQQVGEALESWDAVQARRLNLNKKVSCLDMSYSGIEESRDLIPDEPYWEEFVKKSDWHKMDYSWKYVCTHSFSLKRDLFWKIGGLKKNYIFYGFEDTDLGYRLVKFGYKLHLLDLKVYHLFHEDTHSEFFNIKAIRHSLLTRTAQIFYLHHLDEDIFENLMGFMEPESSFQRTLSRFFDLLRLKFIWRDYPPVYKSLPSQHSEEL